MTDPSTFTQRPRPGGQCLEGKTIRVEPVDWARHGEGLAMCLLGPDHDHLWTYIPMGPFDNLEAFRRTMERAHDNLGWQTMVLVRPEDDRVMGTASYMRIRPEHGAVETGSIVLGDGLRRSRAATEAHFLMAAHVFDGLGYRRYEWKCDNANAASRRAAQRLGFVFEGIFRKDMVVKGRNRDTAWFSITDEEWPALKAGFQAWLHPDNFDRAGNQLRTLEDCRSSVLT